MLASNPLRSAAMNQRITQFCTLWLFLILLPIANSAWGAEPKVQIFSPKNGGRGCVMASASCAVLLAFHPGRRDHFQRGCTFAATAESWLRTGASCFRRYSEGGTEWREEHGRGNPHGNFRADGIRNQRKKNRCCEGRVSSYRWVSDIAHRRRETDGPRRY